MIGSGFEKYSCPIQGLIEFTDVHFHYPTRPNTMCLKGINFQVRPGQYIALVGPSGCGKSTTIGLIERFYDISNGSITIDGANISDLHLPSYRDHIALVGQEPALFNISIKDNILLGSRSYGEAPSMEDVIAAAKSANIHDFIISLPNGYDTLAGGKGMQMSGGQKQRIAIARALIRNPKVLLLDEATSALDADSEKVVQAALDAAAKGRTTISIAHRLSTIKRADLILVMKDGLIVERGTHDQLLSQNGLYCEMVQQQVLDRST
ncbi:multidrug-resistance transporter mdr2 [Entomophthora muscae]|nr:multidrug-resistance transporter mdr2 [Entomophthora muscae]